MSNTADSLAQLSVLVGSCKYLMILIISKQRKYSLYIMFLLFGKGWLLFVNSGVSIIYLVGPMACV